MMAEDAGRRDEEVAALRAVVDLGMYRRLFQTAKMST